MVHLVIDLGSSTTTIFQQGKGVVLKEPSVLIVEKLRTKMVASSVGSEVRDRFSANDLSRFEQVIYPVQNGAIVSREGCELMLRHYLRKVLGARFIMKNISAIVTIPCGISIVERENYERVMKGVGISETILLESVLALASGSKFEYNFVVSSGAQNTDIAIVSKKGILHGISVNISGNAMTKAIMIYLKEQYEFKVREAVAESLKLSIGSLKKHRSVATMATGFSTADNAPKKMEVSAEDIRRAIEPTAEALAFGIESVSFMCTNEDIAQTVFDAGIIFAGGVAETHGLADYICDKLYFPVNIPEQPTNAIVIGAGYYINNPDKLNDVLSIGK